MSLCENNVKVKKLSVRDSCIKNLKNKNFNSKNSEIKESFIKNAGINNLDISKISVNGKDVTCKLDRMSLVTQNYDISLFGETGPVPDNVNVSVYNCLMKNAIDYGYDLQNRIFEGRNKIAEYIAKEKCPLSCPPAPTGPAPLEIYGSLTLPIYKESFCGSTGNTGFNSEDILNTSVSFNLQVTYLLNKADSIDARNVSVLVQVGYVDPLGPTGEESGCTGITGGQNVVINEVFVANKQFYPTLDLLYGENFANTISIPSQILQRAYLSSPADSQGAIQIVIYKEEGLCIWTPRANYSECLGSGNQGCQNCLVLSNEQIASGRCPQQKICLIRGQGPRDFPFTKCVPCLSKCPIDTVRVIKTNCPDQISNANIYSNYSSLQTFFVTSLLGKFTLSKSAPSTQWVYGFYFSGTDENKPYGYFGVNTDENGNFMVLGSIFNGLSAKPAQPYVTAESFGGEGIGWSLRIERKDISNFPIQLNVEYTLEVNKQKIEENQVFWEFIITNNSSNVKINLGTITTAIEFEYINNTSLYQFTENFGPPIDCAKIPLSTITWTYLQTNNVYCDYIPWTPGPGHCGEYTITPNEENKTVFMSFGCTTCQ